jgi:hypothetical protein
MASRIRAAGDASSGAFEWARLAEHHEVGETILWVRPERAEEIEPLRVDDVGVGCTCTGATQADHELEPGRLRDAHERSDRRCPVARLEGGEGGLRGADGACEGSLGQTRELTHDEDQVAGAER